MSLNFPLSAPTFPFFTGIGVSPDVPWLLPISIGGHAYLADTPNIKRETIDTLRPAVDYNTEPGQHSLNTAGVWTSVVHDWRHGAGQVFYDTRDANPSMFRSSKGVDIWTREQLSLLPDTRSILSMAVTPLCLCSVGNELWVGGETTLKRSTTAHDASPSWSTITINAAFTGNDLVDLCTDGGRIFGAFGAGGIGMATKGGSAMSPFSDYAADRVFYANGRLFAASAGELVEINSAGTASAPIWSGGIGSDEDIVSVIGTPSGVLIAYNTLDRGEVLYLGLNPQTGLLAAPLAAGELNTGELFNEIVYYQEHVLATTSRGFRVGPLTNSGRAVGFGPVIEIGDSAGVAAFGQYAWFIWNAYDADSNGLGRCDLSTFTEDLVPAYASDLMLATAVGTITKVVLHQGKPVMAVAGVGAYAQHATNLVASGTLRSGLLRFKTFERKVSVSVDLRHEPLAGTISVDVLDESGDASTVGHSNVASSLGPSTPLGAATIEGEGLEVEITLNAADTPTTGPTLHRFTLRAMIIPQRTDVIQLPLVLRTVVKAGPTGETPIAYDVLEEFRYLKSLESSRTVVTLVMGDQAETVVIDKIGITPERWTSGNHWFEGIVTVQLLTLSGIGER